jgi:Tol biopolymer transport system component
MPGAASHVTLHGMRTTWIPISALLAGMALAAPAQAAFPGANGDFAYEVLTGGIRTAASDGGGDTAIVAKGNQMSYSPDGRSLVYAGRSGTAGVWTAAADGSHKRQLLDPATTSFDGHATYLTFDPRWSPDGTRIVFTALYETRVEGAEDGEVEEHFRVATIGADGRGLTVVRPGASPSWAPDGKRIAYLRHNGIYTVRTDGTGRKQRLAQSSLFRDHLDYAPDGRRLAFLEYRDAGTVIRVLDVSTGKATTLGTPAEERIDAVVWAPNGKRLAYVSVPRVGEGERTPPSSVVTVRPDGSDRKVKFQLAFDARRGRWAEDLAWQPRP